jgi:hypothetical protein
MKAIYSGCILDPWIEVAKKLKKEINLEPVYWISWNISGEEELVKSEFPETIFHGFVDAWKGVFPEETKSFKESPIDADFLNRNAFHELMAIKMMDRMDPDRHSFNFSQRQRFFRMLLRKWSGIIDEINPDIIISASIPHRVFDYALYVVAKEKGKPFLTYQPTYIKGLLIPISDIYSQPKKIDKHKTSDSAIRDLSSNTQEALNMIMKDYNLAEPDYMREKKKAIRKQENDNLISKIKRISTTPQNYLKFISQLPNSSYLWFKERDKNPEESEWTNFDFELLKNKGKRYKNKLKKYYNSLTEKPNFKDKYILVALHYQPEATSVPSGGYYADQFLMIDMLSKTIPKDWKIYIKEHRSQFYPFAWGENGREKYFYDDILKLKNTKLISCEDDPFKLIDNSMAVATVTGTIGFEARVRGKAVLVFGNAWYGSLSSVFKINNTREAVSAIEEIKVGIKAGMKEVYSFLYHIENKIGIEAYHYGGEKERSGVSKKKAVESLSNSVKDFLA